MKFSGYQRQTVLQESKIVDVWWVRAQSSPFMAFYIFCGMFKIIPPDQDVFIHQRYQPDVFWRWSQQQWANSSAFFSAIVKTFTTKLRIWIQATKQSTYMDIYGTYVGKSKLFCCWEKSGVCLKVGYVHPTCSVCQWGILQLRTCVHS